MDRRKFLRSASLAPLVGIIPKKESAPEQQQADCFDTNIGVLVPRILWFWLTKEPDTHFGSASLIQLWLGRAPKLSANPRRSLYAYYPTRWHGHTSCMYLSGFDPSRLQELDPIPELRGAIERLLEFPEPCAIMQL